MTSIFLHPLQQMGTWGTAIKDNDTFADVYDDFFERYNAGDLPSEISTKLIRDNGEIINIQEDKHNFWFALALAQWETKTLDPNVFAMVEYIITTGQDLKLWSESGASPQDLAKRKIALEKFLDKLKSIKPKVKARKKTINKTPVFSTGDCIVFRLKNGNYGGAIVLATDTNPATANNLVATTRLNCKNKPTAKDFENAEVLVCGFGQWQERPEITWRGPELYKNYAHLFEVVGNIKIEIEYDPNDYEGTGHLFRPSWSGTWSIDDTVERQIEFEVSNPKPTKTIKIAQLVRRSKWWKIF